MPERSIIRSSENFVLFNKGVFSQEKKRFIFTSGVLQKVISTVEKNLLRNESLFQADH